MTNSEIMSSDWSRSAMAERNLIRSLCWSTLVLSMLATASPLVARDLLAAGAASNAQVRRPASQGYPEAEARAVMSENERKIRDLQIGRASCRERV